MIEKVNPKHPDKIADQIAGAIVDLAYKLDSNPKIAVEVQVGHGTCSVTIESSVLFQFKDIKAIIARLAGKVKKNIVVVSQDIQLSKNQEGKHLQMRAYLHQVVKENGQRKPLMQYLETKNIRVMHCCRNLSQ